MPLFTKCNNKYMVSPECVCEISAKKKPQICSVFVCAPLNTNELLLPISVQKTANPLL